MSGLRDLLEAVEKTIIWLSQFIDKGFVQSDEGLVS